MKKFVIIAFAILIVIMCGIIFADKLFVEEESKEVKVGVILNGKKDDKSWVQSHYEGIMKSSKKLDFVVEYRENVPETEECIAVMEELIEEDCEVIICNSFNYGEHELKVAKNNPEIYFYHAAGLDTADNFSSYFGRIYQMRYLCGIVAGMQTKTNEIGYVAAFPISEVNRGINAFTLGVRSVNPDAKVYVEWSNSWIGEKESEAATEALFDKHENIDVLTLHADTQSPLKIADERGVWTIGYNCDNSESYPDSFLTAAVWNWEKFYTPRMQEYMQGKFISENYWVDASTGIVDIAPLTKNVREGIKEVVEKEKKRLESGTFDVFYGPILDSNGEVRIKEGESMPDSELLNKFDWYVQGVVTDEN